MRGRELHELMIEIAVGRTSSMVLGSLIFVLAATYLLMFYCQEKQFIQLAWGRKSRLLMKAVNWSIFGIVFFLSRGIIDSEGLLAFRATARIALYNLVLAELAYQFIMLKDPVMKKVKSWKMLLSQ